jgi:hypothetical protein
MKPFLRGIASLSTEVLSGYFLRRGIDSLYKHMGYPINEGGRIPYKMVNLVYPILQNIVIGAQLIIRGIVSL